MSAASARAICGCSPLRSPDCDQRPRLGEVLLGLRPHGRHALLGRGQVGGQAVDGVQQRRALADGVLRAAQPAHRPAGLPGRLVLLRQVRRPAAPPASRTPASRTFSATDVTAADAYRPLQGGQLLLLHRQPLLQFRDPPAQVLDHLRRGPLLLAQLVEGGGLLP